MTTAFAPVQFRPNSGATAGRVKITRHIVPDKDAFVEVAGEWAARSVVTRVRSGQGSADQALDSPLEDTGQMLDSIAPVGGDTSSRFARAYVGAVGTRYGGLMGREVRNKDVAMYQHYGTRRKLQKARRKRKQKGMHGPNLMSGAMQGPRRQHIPARPWFRLSPSDREALAAHLVSSGILASRPGPPRG